MGKVHVYLSTNANILKPSQARQFVETILDFSKKQKEDVNVFVNVEDYFTIKYFNDLSILENIDSTFIDLDGNEYNSMYDVPSIKNGVLKVFEDIYLLDVKVIKKKEGRN